MQITFERAEPFIAELLEAAGEMRSRLRAVLDQVDAPSYATDAEGFIIYYNKSCIDFLGRNPDVGRDRWHVAWKLYTAEGNYLPHDYSPMAKTIKSRKPVRGTTVLAARPDGVRVQFAPFPTPFYDGHGKFAGAINILVGIDEAPNIAKLRQQAERCRRLRFELTDERIHAVFGQIAAAYESKVGELDRHSAKAHEQQRLGDVLYANPKIRVPEKEWASFMQSIAGGDRDALDALCLRAYPVVLTLMQKLCGPEKAAAIADTVFQDVWRRASTFESESDTVLGWIMTQARSRAIAAARTGAAEVAWVLDKPEARDILVQFPAQGGSGSSSRKAADPWFEPEWENVAAGIECTFLATDAARDRISMLVRLGPNASYPAHTHAGVEELHLLEGELWIDDRKLVAGDYNYAAPGSSDQRVWSETGCMCLLVTSTRDILH